MGKRYQGEILSVYEVDYPLIIVHTGGSTGTTKGVMLSNESCNALIYQLLYSNIDFKRKGRFLNILPPFIALGLINATHLAAFTGLEVVLIPSFEPEDFPNLVLKHKPNLVMAGPIHFHMMLNSKKWKRLIYPL